MDRLEQYRYVIVTLLRDVAELVGTDPQVEAIVVTDRENDQYQLLFLGWEGGSRIFDAAIHIRIRDGKIWLEHNTTPERIGEQLIAAGIPRTSIVLGFQPHDLRHLTNFAAA